MRGQLFKYIHTCYLTLSCCILNISATVQKDYYIKNLKECEISYCYLAFFSQCGIWKIKKKERVKKDKKDYLWRIHEKI